MENHLKGIVDVVVFAFDQHRLLVLDCLNAPDQVSNETYERFGAMAGTHLVREFLPDIVLVEALLKAGVAGHQWLIS